MGLTVFVFDGAMVCVSAYTLNIFFSTMILLNYIFIKMFEMFKILILGYNHNFGRQKVSKRRLR